MSKRKEYHQSEIAMYLKCGLAWEFRYVDKVRVPSKTALTVGAAVDAAVTYNMVEKMKTGVDLPAEQVLDTFSTDFDTRAQDTDWGDDIQGKQKDIGAQCVSVHHAKIAPTIIPESVQEDFVIETDAGYDLGGIIDLTEPGDIVVDTKTSKNEYKPDAITRAIQPAMYDFAYEALKGRPAKAFRYDVLVKPTARKPAREQQVQARVTADDRQWLFNTISQVHKAIAAGIALPPPDIPGIWFCTRKWCSYWTMCPKGAGR